MSAICNNWLFLFIWEIVTREYYQFDSVGGSYFNNTVQELLGSLGALEFSSGNASIDGVSNCSGDVSMQSFFRIK